MRFADVVPAAIALCGAAEHIGHDMASYGRSASKREVGDAPQEGDALKSGSGRVTSRKQAIAIGLSEARKKCEGAGAPQDRPQEGRRQEKVVEEVSVRGWAPEGVTQREQDVAMVSGDIGLCPLRGHDRVDRPNPSRCTRS
jgi:hypothetical protein